MTTATANTFNPATVALIVKEYGYGDSGIITRDKKVSRRKATKSDIREAFICGLTDENGFMQYDAKIFPSQLDADVLWCILGDAIKECTGFSITRHHVWRYLGLWETTKTAFYQDWMLEEMRQCLVSLDLAGKIKFLDSGSIWDISVL
jgi:hypothetical protein